MSRNDGQVQQQPRAADLLLPTPQSPAQAKPDGDVSLWRLIFFGSGGDINQEQGQAVARVALSILGSAMLAIVRAFDGADNLPVMLALSYMLASIFYLSYIARHKATHLWRRYVAIVADLSVATLLTAYFGTTGIAFYPLFLWVMIGNGLRYGQHHMQIATLVGLLGFTGAAVYNGYLAAEPLAYTGLMGGLVLMPKFFVVMIERLARANIELQQQKEHAEYMATHDVLTGLPNRAYLHTRMEQSLARAKRNDSEVAVAFIDLDAFKAINDTYGHEYGDYLLTQVADAMRLAVRASDTVARLGGDEFVVLIEDYVHGEGSDIGRFIERLFSCVGRYYTISEYETYVTWSCGVVVYPRDGQDVHTLLKHADTAMYAAKAMGPNNYAFYDATMSQQVGEQLELRDDLRQALERSQLEVYYQPIVDAKSGRVSSAEALLRWNHPTRGLLAPGQFIDVAEHSGLINPIGEWVLREALKTAAVWREMAGYDITMHVNVSAHQLMQPGFVDQVQSALRDTGLPSDVLDLEMTESALIEDSKRAECLLGALAQIGVKIALDDFGTGFSSLSYLKHLPVNVIKIDKSFIDDLTHGERDGALVEAILTIGNRLGFDIIAEGVETEEQLNWLLAHGCRYLQGYHFSRPMTQTDFFNQASNLYRMPRSVAPPLQPFAIDRLAADSA
ncbi:putative bifunctional diguanylate cyclase/phosphodiesterase [Thiosocius teredinicola]|uniref:putative bifunctional diguanylate cyclase/phosphodiesterase n=1 Tax=Thiosocius teredinicola TaxID=1973002 RepID=UPI000990DD3C